MYMLTMVQACPEAEPGRQALQTSVLVYMLMFNVY